jgi:hypothetical protein
MFSLCASRHLALFSLCVFSLWPLVICADVCVAPKVDIGNAIIKLMSAAVQATIMGSLGPFVLYFGRDIDNIVIVVQAALIADFAKLSFYFEGFCPAKIPIIGKGFLNVGMSTVGIAFGMIKDKGFQATAQGISLGMIAMTPAMGSISKPILEATDQKTCKATPDFPGGAPCGSSKTSTTSTNTTAASSSKKSAAPDLCELPDLKIDAMFSLWFVAGLPTLTALIMGKIATMKMPDVDVNADVNAEVSFKTKLLIKMNIVAELIKDLSFSFTGSFMALKAFLDIGVPVWQVADPCGAEAALPAINGMTTALTYALGGASFLWQRIRKAGRGKGKEPKGLIVKINNFIGKCAGEGKKKKKQDDAEEEDEEEEEAEGEDAEEEEEEDEEKQKKQKKKKAKKEPSICNICSKKVNKSQDLQKYHLCLDGPDSSNYAKSKSLEVTICKICAKSIGGKTVQVKEANAKSDPVHPFVIEDVEDGMNKDAVYVTAVVPTQS